MRSKTSLYGENAGRIWKVVNEKSSVDEQTLKQITMLNNEEFHAAIGWLARENKIKKTDDAYSLDDSNLEKDIGTTAGRIWKILDIWEEADIHTLKKLADTPDEDIYAGLGWLAREGKVDISEQNRFYLK
ncbi:MAG: winged helix-turn-helix domain-containing protein [Thermoplasmatota archaeon]